MHIDSTSVDADFDALAYSYETPRAYANAGATFGERSLWCAVIEQAFMDAGLINVSRGTEKNNDHLKANSKDEDDALRWLLRGKSDFIYVCMLAGISPYVIRHAAKLLI